ncbi:MAG: hypothetical protein ACI91Z_000448 [Yoonia sp.]|jgi:uncharacterized protein
MKGRIRWPLFAFALWLASITLATAQTYPIDHDTYVNDYADLLSDVQETALRKTLIDLRKNRDVEMTVLTIERRSDYGQTVSNEAFATALFNHWGIGHAARNDGILFLVSRSDRDMRIEVGSSYGATHDAALKQIIDRVIIPKFRLDTYDTGIQIGVNHAIREITGAWPGQYDANIVTRWWTDLKIWLGAFIIVPFGLIGVAVWRTYLAARRRAPRRCPVDGSWMPRVLDEFEHKHLTDGQQKEEQLASKEYDVWICRDCDHVTIKGFQRWFSGQKLCKKCNYATLESTGSQIIYHPTPTSAGTKRTDFRCNHCNADYPVFTILASMGSGSSGGSSGGGSFGGGGGSSSGGGASGNW